MRWQWTPYRFVAVYDSVDDAEADYKLVKELHTEANLIDAYDAAVVEREADGKVKIRKKHETPTRVGGVAGAGGPRNRAGGGIVPVRRDRRRSAGRHHGRRRGSWGGGRSRGCGHEPKRT